MEKPKRFYKTVSIAEGDEGFTLRLDDRPARTPQRRLLSAPTKALADLLAAEWDAQVETIDTLAMPLTRLAVTALDKGQDEAEAWAADIVRYAGSDLLCYRADTPEALAERQAAAWDPYLKWARDALKADFEITGGVLHIAQRPETLDAVKTHLADLSAFHLIGVKSAAEAAGSAILALALLDARHAADDIFEACRVDERFQAEKWGVDEEAVEREAAVRADFLAMGRFLRNLA